MLILNRLVSAGGWIEKMGVSIFNLYRPPTIELGDASKAGPWVEHVHKVYPENADHIIYWFAHRRQKPQDKINHALLLGGLPGIGKDTLLEGVKQAVGPWNFSEISPKQMLGRFNGFLKSTVMRISEARDLGDISRYEFYDAMKAYLRRPTCFASMRRTATNITFPTVSASSSRPIMWMAFTFRRMTAALT
jgi:hypothetical protein